MAGDQGIVHDLCSSISILEKEDAALAKAVAVIIWSNLAAGRIESFTCNGKPVSPCEYVSRVARNYKKWGRHVRHLMDGDGETWQSQYVLFRKWAYCLLQRWGVAYSRTELLLEHACICASEAAIILLKKRYPFDVGYERWAYMVLRFACMHHVADEVRASQDKNGSAIVSLDNWEGWLDNCAVAAKCTQLEEAEQRLDLLSAVSELSSDARRQFIVLFYFEGRTIDEIAQSFGRNKNALYKLHHDALSNLRAVWQSV